MTVQLRSEWVKLTSTKTWWLLLLGMTVFSAGFSAFLLLAAFHAPRSPVDLESPGSAVIVYNMAAAIAYIFPLTFGVLLVTAEYRSRLIVPTLLAEPRRFTVYAGKFLTAAGVALVYGIVSVGTCVAVAATMLEAEGTSPQLSHPDVVSGIVGSVAVLALWGPIGVGLGALLRNQVAAIVGTLIFTQFVESLVRMGAGQAGVPELATLLPGGAGSAASGGTVINAASAISAPSPLVGFGILAAYAAAFVVLGGVRFSRYQLS